MTKDKKPGGMRRSLTSYGDDDFALFLRQIERADVREGGRER